MPGMEEFWFWLKTHQDLLQNISIVAGLIYTGYSVWKEDRTRRVDNLITFTQQHRDIWKMYEHPELSRVLDAVVDLKRKPVTRKEHLFVSLLIMHLSTVHKTTSEGMFMPLKGLRKDIELFFVLPIPWVVWLEMREFQDTNFVQFVESCLEPLHRK
jgi:hypothetical protein